MTRWTVLLALAALLGGAEPVPDYDRDIRPILADSCTRCHGPAKTKAGLRLDSPEGILKGSAKRPVVIPGDPSKSPLLIATTLNRDDDDFMPANGEPLKPAQIALLRAWIAAGAPVAGTTGAAAPAPSPSAPKPPVKAPVQANRPASAPVPPPAIATAQTGPRYSTDIKPILAESCSECHGAEKAKAGLRLDAPEYILKGSRTRPVVVPGDPATSPLYIAITRKRDDDDFMPANGEPLKPAQIALVRAWIAAGAVFDGETPGPVLGRGGAKPGAAAELPHLRTAPPVDPASIPGIAKLLAVGMTAESLDEGWLINAGHLPRGITEEHLRLLAAVGGDIRDLSLATSGITDRQVRQLGALSGLVRLNLSRNPTLGDAGIGELAALPAAAKLEWLNLYATGITDRSVETLVKLKNLEELLLWQTKVTPAAIERLRQALPSCHLVLGPTDLPGEPLAKPGSRKKKKP